MTGAISARVGAYLRLGRFDKPVGWLLLLWPTLWALWHASAGRPDIHLVALFCAGVIGMRTAGCCVNDIADRKLDAQVSRTRMRPLACGQITVVEAAAMAGVLLLCCFALWWQLNGPARAWALGALLIALSYPLAKRYTKVPQLHLCVAFGMGIVVAYAQVLGRVPTVGWLLFAANACWVFAYDTIYAMVDRDDDIKAQANSAAIWLGKQEILAVSLAFFLMLACLLMFGIAIGAKFSFYFACALGFLMAGHYLRLIRGRERERCFASFKQNHWLGALIWLGLVSNYAS